jgi:hypothetical protein
MNSIVRFFTILSGPLNRVGTCGIVGFIAGSIAGLLLTILDFFQGSVTLSQQEAIYISLLLAGFTWIVVLFILTILVRLTFRSVALASLVNCLLTCFATVFLTRALNNYALAWFIGMVCGILIGMLLCRINALLTNSNS